MSIAFGYTFSCLGSGPLQPRGKELKLPITGYPQRARPAAGLTVMVMVQTVPRAYPGLIGEQPDVGSPNAHRRK